MVEAYIRDWASALGLDCSIGLRAWLRSSCRCQCRSLARLLAVEVITRVNIKWNQVKRRPPTPTYLPHPMQFSSPTGNRLGIYRQQPFSLSCFLYSKVFHSLPLWPL